MDKNEINKGIAEYMGLEIVKSAFHESLYFADGRKLGEKPTNYTDSLDALVPVWEKIYTETSHGVINDIVKKIYDSITYQDFKTQSEAAISTYKAIKELNNKEG